MEAEARRKGKLREREDMMRKKGGRKKRWRLKLDAKLTQIEIGQGKKKPREGMTPLTLNLMNHLRRSPRRELIQNHPNLRRKRINPLIRRVRMRERRNQGREAERTVKMRMTAKRKR